MYDTCVKSASTEKVRRRFKHNFQDVNSFKKKNYLSVYLYQFSSVTPVTGSQLLFAIVASLLHLQVLKFFCFITLTTSLSHFISGLPLLFLPSGDQIILLTEVRRTIYRSVNKLKNIIIAGQKI
jgi:ABC-type uncharacterized transport system permease subunit